MLILSRKVKQQILIPQIETAFQILEIRGNTVRVGIEAPDGIVIVREEIENKNVSVDLLTQILDGRKQNHDLRNQMNHLRTAVSLLRMQIQRGVEKTDVLETIESVERSLDNDTKSSPVRQALLVEDDRNERELLAGFLRMSGVEVITKSDGPEAMEYLNNAEKQPDVVLLDMGLPQMDGKEVVRKIRSNPKIDSLKIFVISGREKEEIGADYWFRKPVNPERIVENIGGIVMGTR